MPDFHQYVEGMPQNMYTQIIAYLVKTCHNGNITLDLTELSEVVGCIIWIENGQLKIRSS